MAFKFNRGISDHFVGRLNEEYERSSWWKAIATDPTLFVAIREGYLNVYWKGNSLLKLTLGIDKKLVGEVHYKYLLKCNARRPYVRIGEDGRVMNLAAAGLFVDGLAKMDDLKRAAGPYAGEEKDGVHAIVLKNSGVMDVEITFGTGASDEDKASTSRIDFAALRVGSDGAEIVFYEAKLFSNKEVRANGSNSPPVTAQLKKYRDLLTKHSVDVVSSYQRVCNNLTKLNGVAARYPKELLKTMHQVSSGDLVLSVDPAVRLIIFGYDRDQDKGAVWKIHRDKLEKDLRGRLELRGNAHGFRL